MDFICPKCGRELSLNDERYLVHHCDKCKKWYDSNYNIISSFDVAALAKMDEKNRKQYLQDHQPQPTPTQVTCPKCGSTQIQLVPRKWSLMTGIFTNKVDRVCVNCKNKF